MRPRGEAGGTFIDLASGDLRGTIDQCHVPIFAGADVAPPEPLPRGPVEVRLEVTPGFGLLLARREPALEASVEVAGSTAPSPGTSDVASLGFVYLHKETA